MGASLGSVLEVNRRLREGAAPDELIGGLSKTPDQLWNEQAEAAHAALVAKDGDNQTLFGLARGVRPASGYETLSKQVWRTEKSKMILKGKIDPAVNKMETLFLFYADPTTAMEAYVLHAALVARARGHEGFVFAPVLAERVTGAMFRTGKRGEKGFPAELFISADDVIAKLTPIIPSPAELKARRAGR